MQEFWTDKFAPADAEIIWAVIAQETDVKPPLGIAEMIDVYISPGSQAATIKTVQHENEILVACGGIVDMRWQRGEAWILTTQLYGQYLKTCFPLTRVMFEEMMGKRQFRRIQATSYSEENGSLFRHLGFDKEAVLEKFGPNGEDGIIYKIIPGG